METGIPLKPVKLLLDAGYLIMRGAGLDSIKDSSEIVKECISQMDAGKERLEENIRIDLESWNV